MNLNSQSLSPSALQKAKLHPLHFFPLRISPAHRETTEAKSVCRATTCLFCFNLLPLVAASVRCRGLWMELRCCFHLRSVWYCWYAVRLPSAQTAPASGIWCESYERRRIFCSVACYKNTKEMQSESGVEGFISVASANWASSWFRLNLHSDRLQASGCVQNFYMWLSSTPTIF